MYHILTHHTPKLFAFSKPNFLVCRKSWFSTTTPFPHNNNNNNNNNIFKMSFEEKIKQLNITLPDAPPPLFSYVPTVLSGNLLWVAGQISKDKDGTLLTGKVGKDRTLNDANYAARVCALNALAQVKKAIGSLDNVVRIVKVVGFVASHEGFTDQPKVINGASDLLVEIFGEQGKHARSAVGVSELPLGVSVELSTS